MWSARQTASKSEGVKKQAANKWEAEETTLGGIHLLRSQNFQDFGPPPPLVRFFWLNHKTKFTQPCLLRLLLGILPSPPLCERNKWIAPEGGGGYA